MTLTAHEGRDVAQATVRITNAGDGLSDALSIAPTEYHIDETVYVVLETVVSRVSHEPIKDTEVLRRVHTLKAADGTVVDEEVVHAIFEAHRIAVEKAQGIERLPLADDDE